MEEVMCQLRYPEELTAVRTNSRDGSVFMKKEYISESSHGDEKERIFFQHHVVPTPIFKSDQIFDSHS